MKKLISLTLATMLIAAALAGCASIKPGLDPQIRITSSDAESAAQWLDQRLDTIPDRIVIGTDSAKYGIDVSALEDDGYIIRNLGGEVALFARTEDGLDRAVRKYAKSVDAGDIVADETYHEGYRVNKLTVAGNDISEYAIRVEGGNEYWHRRVVNEAAANLSALIGIACGFAPEVGGEAEHTILFRWIEDETFSEGTFRYFVENGDLIIEFVELLGANYAMQTIMEEELGWIDLTAGYDYLPESDAVDIPEGTMTEIHPMFDAYIPGALHGKHSYDLGGVGFFENKDGRAGHGLQDRRFNDIFPRSGQPCMTDETVRGYVVDILVAEFIEPVLRSGGKIRDELTNIQMGQRDSAQGWGTFCTCKNCSNVYRQEGSYAGLMLRWINAIDDDVDTAGYDGIVWNIFAYTDTKYPPKITKPNDDVYIMMCTDIACDKHLLDGSQCQWKTYLADRTWYSNAMMSDYIKGWTEMCDNVFIYHYALDNGFNSHCMLDTLYEDNLTFKRLGVKRMMWEVAGYDKHYTPWTPGKGMPRLGFYMIMQAMCVWQNLHPDATKQDYLDHYQITLERLYGDGWRDVSRFIDLWDEAELASQHCSTCWADYNDHMDPDTYLSHWDEMIDCLDRAALLANNEEQYEKIKVFLAQVYYTGCFLGYDDAVAAGDAGRMEFFADRYLLFVSSLKDVGYGLKYGYLNSRWTIYGETIEGMNPVTIPYNEG